MKNQIGLASLHCVCVCGCGCGCGAHQSQIVVFRKVVLTDLNQTPEGILATLDRRSMDAHVLGHTTQMAYNGLRFPIAHCKKLGDCNILG